MQLTVLFEHWHLGDGNYPAFAVGDEARLSFELDVRAVDPVGSSGDDEVRQLWDAEYELIGRVIRQYSDGTSSPFPVVEAGWLRVYCPASAATQCAIGSRVKLRGRLALDHYLWVEFLEQYPDPPDLFYAVRVLRVRRVAIPERFIQRSEHAMSHPTAVGPDEYSAADVREVPAVSDEGDGPAFSLLDLELLPPGQGPQHPTFIGA